jgi:hypothetical protein
MQEPIRLKDRSAFGLEMQARLDQSDSDSVRSHIVAVDAILSTYREQVAADRAKVAPSGNRYFTAEQLQERRQVHARLAAEAIQALQPAGLDSRIAQLQTRLKAIEQPTYDEGRMERIRSELAAIKDDPLQLRPYVSTALARHDGEVLRAVVDWPGHPGGELLKDQWHSDKLLPKVQQWLSSHHAPADHAELQGLLDYQGQLQNVRQTALKQLAQEAPGMLEDPIEALANSKDE